MKNCILFAVLVFPLLLVLSLNEKAYAETVDEDNEVSVVSELPVDYSEVNILIDKLIFQKISDIIRFMKSISLKIWSFFVLWPSLIKNSILIAMLPASVGIITSHVLAIYKNRNKWLKHPNHDLMHSYFTKSGTLQRKKSYKDAHILLRDHRWLWVSFAGMAFRLGNHANISIMLMFIMSFVYIPLFVFGIIEMTLRILFGTVWLLIFNMIHRIILLLAKLIFLVLAPLSYTIDRMNRKIQHCPYCYETFNLPIFVCPSCGRIHKHLVPGSCGVLFVRCVCNKIFLPCTFITGRSLLDSRCPACSYELAAANARHLSVAVIGGKNAGKTSFIAAFSHIYILQTKTKSVFTIDGIPDNYFNELNKLFSTGKAIDEYESRTYSLVHKKGKNKKYNVVFYDTFAEYLVSDTFSRSPKYFGFCDGIVLIIDPLSVKSVRENLTEDDEKKIMNHYSTDDIDKLVVQFIHKYTTVRGFSTGKMGSTPLAVLINKTDIKAVNSEISREKIKALYNENPSRYGNNENTAKDQICRAYLSRIGLGNVLNNIEATFKNVSFFPVCAVKHATGGSAVSPPISVIEPVAWVAKENHSRLAGLLNKGTVL